jgi:hypothetical protein
MVICTHGQRARAKVPKEHALRLDQELCGCCGFKLRMSAIRLSSGRERAFIFRIRFVRCYGGFGDADIMGNLLV